MFFEHVWSWIRHVWWTIWPLEFEHQRTCLALLWTCLDPNPNLSSERVFINEWPKPIFSHSTGLTGLLWRLQWLVFLDSYKRHSTPSLVGYWFLTICITFLQPLELFQPLFVRSKYFVEDSSVGWRVLCVSHLSSSLDHFGLRQASLKHLLLLEVKPPRRLGITLELPSMWWDLEKFMKVGFTSERKEGSKLVDWEKWLKETQLGVGLVRNSSFLNGDIGIMGWWFWTSVNKSLCLPCFAFRFTY
jgi:hypothetical protein